MENYIENLKVTIGITCFNAEDTITNAIGVFSGLLLRKVL